MPLINPLYLKDIETDLANSNIDYPFTFETYSATHIGLVRDSNEDAFYCNGEQGLWLVADGMGGHSRGGKASAAVVDDMRSFTCLETLTESVMDIETRFLLSNKTCRYMSEKEIVGTTVAALFAYQSMAIFLWAGDSRVYRQRAGNLVLMTEDHTLVQERCRRGEMSQDEVQLLPEANILTRAIGIHQNLRVEMQNAAVQSGDRYLISSDGLYREFTLDEVQNMINADAVEGILDKMVNEALARGGKDNITGVLVQVN